MRVKTNSPFLLKISVVSFVIVSRSVIGLNLFELSGHIKPQLTISKIGLNLILASDLEMGLTTKWSLILSILVLRTMVSSGKMIEI